MPSPSLTNVACLIVIAAAVLPFTAGAARSCETVQIQLHLEGVATRTNGGPDPGFTADIDVDGEGTRCVPEGNGVQIRASGLPATVRIVDPGEDPDDESDDTVVEQYDALVGFHAQEASSIAQGLPAGSFKFNLELRGNRDVAVGIPDDSPTTRVMAFNAHGNAVCTGEEEEGEGCSLAGTGQTTVKSAGGTNHYNIAISGESSSGLIG